jgi:hypothetical protein
MKEVITWCDRCHHQGKLQSPAAATVALRIGATVGGLDLCEPCQKEILGEVEQLLAEYGAPLEVPHGGKVKAAKAADEPGPLRSYERRCPICGVTRSSGTTVAAHMWRDHIGRERPARPEVCPDCGWHPIGSDKPSSAVGKHRQSVHGMDPITEATQMYEAFRSKRVAVARKPTPREPQPEEPEPAAVLLSPAEAAKAAGVNKNIISGCVRRGTLPSVRTATGNVRIDAAELAKWAAARAAG